LGLEPSTPLDPTVLNEDNKGALEWCYNPKQHSKSKHIDISLQSIRERCVKPMQDIAVRYCPTTGMLADILTKQVALRPFQYLTGRIFNRIPRAD
jgi:hypothetical protein